MKPAPPVIRTWPAFAARLAAGWMRPASRVANRLQAARRPRAAGSSFGRAVGARQAHVIVPLVGVEAVLRRQVRVQVLRRSTSRARSAGGLERAQERGQLAPFVVAPGREAGLGDPDLGAGGAYRPSTSRTRPMRARPSPPSRTPRCRGTRARRWLDWASTPRGAGQVQPVEVGRAGAARAPSSCRAGAPSRRRRRSSRSRCASRGRAASPSRSGCWARSTARPTRSGSP